jgi:hypothetical protein
VAWHSLLTQLPTKLFQYGLNIDFYIQKRRCNILEDFVQSLEEHATLFMDFYPSVLPGELTTGRTVGGRNLEAGAGPMGAKLNAGAEPPGPIKFPEMIYL